MSRSKLEVGMVYVLLATNERFSKLNIIEFEKKFSLKILDFLANLNMIIKISQVKE